jgi:uncharacterized protein (TIGR02453 family)
MLQKSTLQFLKNLKNNNNKDWFDANRPAYLAAKQDWEQLVQAVIDSFAQIEPNIADLKAKNCTFRINRDVRFSKNKDPYKCNFGAAISIGGKKSAYATYYFHCEPYTNFIGGGYYMPEPPLMQKVRQEIDYAWPEFKKILNEKSFKKVFGSALSTEMKLVKPPKGYTDDNPAIEFIKLKSFTCGTSWEDDMYVQKNTVKQITSTLQTMKPFIDFLNRAVE